MVLSLAVLVLSGRCHRGPSIAGAGSGRPPAAPADRSVEGGQSEAAPPLLAPGRFAEIVVLDFQDKAPWPDYLTGMEAAGYFVLELASVFKGRISRWTEGDGDVAGRDRAVVLKGSAALTRQMRKALRRRGPPIDGPFRIAGGDLLEQSVYTLALSVTVAAAGEVLLEREFKETRVYEDLEKPPDFALYELLDRVKAELFPALFGRPLRGP